MSRIDRQEIRSNYGPGRLVDQAMAALEPFFQAVDDGTFLAVKPDVDPAAMAVAMSQANKATIRFVVLLSVSDQADGFRAAAEAAEPEYEFAMVDPIAYGVEQELSGPLTKRLEERMTAPAWAPYVDAVVDGAISVVTGFLGAAEAGDAASVARLTPLIGLLPKTLPLTSATGDPGTFFVLVR